MSNNNKRQQIAQKRAKAQLKRRKRKQAQRSQKSSLPGVNIISRPPLSEVEAPNGFRSIGMAQAMAVYAEPIMQLAKNEDDFKEALQLGMQLWNYALEVEKGGLDKKLESTIANTLIRKFYLNDPTARQLLEKMLARRSYLFPQDIQPENPLVMFIRKEKPVAIYPFDYSQLTLTEQTIPPDAKDKVLIENLQKLERDIAIGLAYEKYEEPLFSLKDECQKRFIKWLEDKGLKKDIDLLSSCLDAYFNFIYSYTHNEHFTLESIPYDYLQEFFDDFLLRKVLVPPQEYVYWPVAGKLFYQFLKEKEYLQNADKPIQMLDRLESHFFEILEKQFG